MATPYTQSWIGKKFTLRTYIFLILGPILVFSVLNIFFLSNLETQGVVNKVCVGARGMPLSYPDYFGFYSVFTSGVTDGGFYCGQYALKQFDSPAALYVAVAESILAASLLIIAFYLLLHWIFTRSTQATQPIDPNNLTTRQGVQTALYVGVIIGGFIILYVAIFILSGFLK